MSKIAVEKLASDLVANVDLGDAYDSAKWNLKSLIKKRTDVAGTPNFIGPMGVGVARPVEQTSTAGLAFPSTYSFSPTLDWIFLASNISAAANRAIAMYTFDRTTSTFTYVGYTTVTPPYRTASGNVTIKGFYMDIQIYSTGTVAVSGTAVTGTNTLWLTNKIPAGCQIGFGSTDPTQITTWYDMVSNAVPGGEGTITLTGSAGTVGAGSAYCIIDMRAVWVQTHATAANGSGVFCVKGLAKSHFTPGGTAVAAATTVDNIRACYWLAEASTQVELAPYGIVVVPAESRTVQYAYVLDSTTALKWSKYNIRTSETYSAGVSSTYTHFICKTGTQVPTGAVVTANNGAYGVLQHGGSPVQGVPCLFWMTATRIYATVISTVVASGTSWLSANMTENPPGSSTTFALTGALSMVGYDSMTDRLVVLSTGTAAGKSYVTQWRTDGGQMENIILVDSKQINQSSVSSGAAMYPVTQSGVMHLDCRNGVLYLIGTGTTAVLDILYAVPMGADWNRTSYTGQRAITPAFSTPNCLKYGRVYVVRDRIIGDEFIGAPPDPLKILYRTSGISDNSGAWLSVPEPNDLSGVAGAAQIQFALEFKTVSDRMLPSRVFLVGITYDDTGIDSHYQPSIIGSDLNNKRFGFRFQTAWGSTVPAMKVVLYNADTGATLLTDYTATPTGTFEKSTNDGVGWSAYNTTDLSGTATYVRYTPASLADGIKVRPVFSQA